MQIDFADFEPGKPMIIENYGKRITITVEELATEDRVQEAIESAYGPFNHVFKVKPSSTLTFNAEPLTEQKKSPPVATPEEPDLVEYVYWNSDKETETTLERSSIESALFDARDDFARWVDKPLEIRVNGLIRYTWRDLWRKLTPLPLIGPLDQVNIFISPR